MGLSDQARTDLLARLPVHQGDVLNEETAKRVQEIVHEFDEHLNARVITLPNGDTTIMIVAPNSQIARCCGVASLCR